jgi:hypothetical protein
MDLSKILVCTATHDIDIEASVQAFRLAVTAVADKRRSDGEVIAREVGLYFDAYPGAHITMPAIQSKVCGALQVSPNAFKDVNLRIQKYVQDNTEKENGLTESGAPAVFQMRKGKGGGFCRLSDQKPASTPTPTTSA